MGEYISNERIENVRQVDLLSYLRQNEPSELVRVSGNTYCTREHDSLRISNGKWYWFSRGFGGYSALDYLIKVKGLSFIDAVKAIEGQGYSCPLVLPKREIKRKLILPKENANNDIAIEYLEDRGIDRGLVEACIKQGIIYESKEYHNVIFIGMDEKKAPRYASYRSTNGAKLVGDAVGSDKRYSFRIDNGDKEVVHIFECPIDLLSYMTMKSKEKWQDENYLSLAGVYSRKSDGSVGKPPVALENYLEGHTGTKVIKLHLDNDFTGRSAASAIKSIYQEEYEVVNELPLYGKDYNEFLQIVIEQDEEWKGANNG